MHKLMSIQRNTNGLPKGWSSLRLKFVCRINPSKTEVAYVPDDSPVSFVPMERVTEDGEVRLTETRALGEVRQGFTYFRDGDVLVAKITPCFENGKGGLCTGLENGIGFGSTEFHVLRHAADTDPRFLFYITRTPEFRDFGTALMYGAAGQQRVPEEFIRNYLACLPSLPEQRRIAAFLDHKTDEIADLIADKQRMIELLQEKRHSLVSQAVTKGLDATVPLKNSGIEWLEMIPVTWRAERLKWTIRKIEQGWSPQCENRTAEVGEWGVLKVGCMNSGVYVESENKALPLELQPVPEFEVRVGDVLMSRSNTVELVGSVGIVHETQGRVMLCDKLYRIVFDRGRMIPEYAVYLLRSRPARFLIERDASGASPSMKNISNDVVSNIVLPIPPKEEQERIVAYLDYETRKSIDLISTIENQIARLREYRQTVISAAVTGQVAIPECSVAGHPA